MKMACSDTRSQMQTQLIFIDDNITWDELLSIHTRWRSFLLNQQNMVWWLQGFLCARVYVCVHVFVHACVTSSYLRSAVEEVVHIWQEWQWKSPALGHSSLSRSLCVCSSEKVHLKGLGWDQCVGGVWRYTRRKIINMQIMAGHRNVAVFSREMHRFSYWFLKLLDGFALYFCEC